jgi:hypothetical protein
MKEETQNSNACGIPDQGKTVGGKGNPSSVKKFYTFLSY